MLRYMIYNYSIKIEEAIMKTIKEDRLYMDINNSENDFIYQMAQLDELIEELENFTIKKENYITAFNDYIIDNSNFKIIRMFNCTVYANEVFYMLFPDEYEKRLIEFCYTIAPEDTKEYDDLSNTWATLQDNILREQCEYTEGQFSELYNLITYAGKLFKKIKISKVF